MKILYGIQTTGSGHLVRAKSMIPELRRKGHEVYTLLSGDPDKSERELEFFRPYVFKQGLTFITEGGKLKYFKTAKNLNFFRFYSDIFSFPARDFDLVITDYEPISARVAKRNRIPSIGVGHIYVFNYSVPVTKGSPFSLFVTRNFAPVDVPIGLHWHHFDQPILPPTIPKDVQDISPVEKNKILVYLPFEDLEQIKKLLASFPKKNFYIYSREEKEYNENNLKVRPLSRETFIQDLGESEGVICNAGFSLLSEALHLGKKILAKPVKKQVEQESNALALENLGLGAVSRDLDFNDIEKWLQRPSIKPQNYPEIIDKLTDWIGQGDWNDLKGLVREIWN